MHQIREDQTSTDPTLRFSASRLQWKKTHELGARQVLTTKAGTPYYVAPQVGEET